MATAKIQPPRYDEARENGDVTHCDGWHKPARFQDRRHFGQRGCGCDLVTEKGAYRDETVEYDGLTVHFYHQSPVVTERDGTYRLSSCGYQTSTTKERINRYLPRGYRVVQRDFVWYLETPEGTEEFEDGMTITP